MANNVVDVIYNGELFFETQHVYQYDNCQLILRDFFDMEYPYEVYFANSKVGRSEKYTAYNDVITVPYKYISTGRDIWAWVHIPSTYGGYTIFTIKIPVKTRVGSLKSNDQDSELRNEIMARLASQDERIQTVLDSIGAVSNFFTDGYLIIEGMTAEERGQYT